MNRRDFTKALPALAAALGFLKLPEPRQEFRFTVNHDKWRYGWNKRLNDEGGYLVRFGEVENGEYFTKETRFGHTDSQ